MQKSVTQAFKYSIVTLVVLGFVLCPASLLPQSKAQSLYSYLQQANESLNNGKLKEAEKQFERALRINDRSVAAMTGLGRIAYQRKKYKDFNNWFKKALRVDPENAEALDFLTNNPAISAILAAADSLSRLGKGEDAERSYKQALEISDQSVAAFRGLGRLAFKNADWGEVKDRFEALLDLQPDDLEALYRLGIAFRATGRYKAHLLKRRDFNRSEKYLDRAIVTDSTYLDLLLQRALLAREREKWFDAVSWGLRQFNLKPGLTTGQTGLFRLIELMLRNQSAEKVSEWTEKQSDEWLTFVAGEQNRLQKNFGAADQIFKSMLENELSISKSLIYLSSVKSLVEQDRPGEASVLFDLALDSIQTHVDAEFLFESSKYIFKDFELTIFRRLEQPEHKKNFFRTFWTSRNPAPASPIHYRAVEHFKRLVHAERNYWYDGVRTWVNNPDKVNRLKFPQVYRLNQEFNDKGLIYIRHGEPDERAFAVGREMAANDSWRYFAIGEREQLIFHFVVDDNSVGNNWRLAPYVTNPRVLEAMLGWDPNFERMYYHQSVRGRELEVASLEVDMSLKSNAAVYTALTTDNHTWDDSVQPLNLHYKLAFFRGARNQTRLAIYFGVPLQHLGDDHGLTEPGLEYGLASYDRYWHLKGKRSGQADLTTLDSVNILNNVFIAAAEMQLKPGDYHFALHAKQPGGDRLGGEVTPIVVPAYNSNKLDMSDIVLANENGHTNATAILNFRGTALLPNPLHRFSPKEAVAVYFEIYNLEQKADGSTRFEIESKMTQLRKKSGGVQDVLGALAGSMRKSISLKVERGGNDRDDFEHTSFDVHNLEEGEYELKIKIKDRNSGSSLEKEVVLTLDHNH